MPVDFHTYLSPHFRLVDFIGNHSFYADGIDNIPKDLPWDEDDIRVRNAQALCTEILEPLLERFGPISISYGHITPEFSRKRVTYMDPDVPSHHRWDKGAAADIIVHKYVQGLPHTPDMRQLFEDDNTRTSPASLAHSINDSGARYSRIISYSESPCLCVAVSAEELENGNPRRAFYENRYTGVPKAKPDYLSMSTPQARARASQFLQEHGLPHPWEGAGYPTYHGKRGRQYQHMRVSKYTTVLDWMQNINRIREASLFPWEKRIPALHQGSVQDAFAAAGILYDAIIDREDLFRLSISAGYEPNWGSDGIFAFAFALPEDRMQDAERISQSIATYLPGAIEAYPYAEGIAIGVHDYEAVLGSDLAV